MKPRVRFVVRAAWNPDFHSALNTGKSTALVGLPADINSRCNGYSCVGFCCLHDTAVRSHNYRGVASDNGTETDRSGRLSGKKQGSHAALLSWLL